MANKKPRIYNEDCISGARDHFKDNSVDLIVTDPPYGIDGASLDKHYARREENIIEGYIDIPFSEYAQFSIDWIKEAYRVLRPNGCMYVISGWTCLKYVLFALDEVGFETINHLIWQYNFGVYTSKKFVSAHYHILFVRKPAKGKDKKKYPYVFNANSNIDLNVESDEKVTKRSYHDRQDVFFMSRKYRPGKKKNKNQLPPDLVRKLIGYSSNDGDIVCDFFLGGFTTAIVAQEMGRVPWGFEMNEHAFNEFKGEINGWEKKSRSRAFRS